MDTVWREIECPRNLAMRLRVSHRLFYRECDGRPIYTVRKVGEYPSPNDGGYATIIASLWVKGM